MPAWQQPFLRRISAKNARTMIARKALMVSSLVVNRSNVLEPAKSSRTTCKTCQGTVAKGALRFGYDANAFDERSKYPRMEWYHATIDCIPAALQSVDESIPSSVLGVALQGLSREDTALSTAEGELMKDLLMRLVEDYATSEDEMVEITEAYINAGCVCFDMLEQELLMREIRPDRKVSDQGATSQADVDNDSPALSRTPRVVGTRTASAVPAFAQSVGSREDAAGIDDDCATSTTQGPQTPRTSAVPAVRVSLTDVRRGKSKGHKRAGAVVQTRELYDYQPRVRAYLEAQYGKVSGRVYSDEKGVACELDMVVQVQVDNSRQLKRGTELLVELKVGTSRQNLKTARGELEWALAYARSSSSAAPVSGMLIVPEPLGEFELKTFIDAGILVEIVLF